MRLLTITCALLISLLSHGQPPQNNNWVFGVQTGIEFTPDGPEVLSTGIDCGFDRAPATISNFQGELMYYADETNVYDISGFPLSNGSYGSNCSESIFIPNSGDPNQIYHIRSFLSGWGARIFDY